MENGQNNGGNTPQRNISSPGTPLHNIPSPATPRRHNPIFESPMYYGTPSPGFSATAASGLTPVKLRSDIANSRRIRQLAETINFDEADISEEPRVVIWGTDVAIDHCKTAFRVFIDQFITSTVKEHEVVELLDLSLPFYPQKIAEINLTQNPFLNVSCEHIKSFDPRLYERLVLYPQEVIPTFDMAINELFFERFPHACLDHHVQVRPYDVVELANMRSLNPEDIDRLITVKGMVIRTSDIIPELREALYQCCICKQVQTVEIDNGNIVEPNLCENCGKRRTFVINNNRSLYTDKQMIKIQESPEDMPDGQTPQTVIVYAHGEMVETVQPGDRVSVTGIYRAYPIRIISRTRNISSIFRTYIDVLHFHRSDANKIRENVDSLSSLKLCDERIAEIKDLVNKLGSVDRLYSELANSISPSIYGQLDIKKGILLQLFGGTPKDFSAVGRGRFRNEVNILLCGDPGTSKSQHLQYVYKLIPRSQYTSGKGSSAVGLTAFISKDPETRQTVLQTGALVMCDNGICCIDEFDKMSDTTKNILHEVMEQQTLSIAKAGIICSLNARTSILAAANPVESKWNTKKTIIDNLMLPHTLLSRFDLIFLFLDQQDEVYDRRLASHVISLYYQRFEGSHSGTSSIDSSLLRDYIAFAKTTMQPKLSEEVQQVLVDEYVDMRRIGSGRGQVTAYPRQLESLIRLSEAHAKMRLSEWVELMDVEEARRLIREALKQVAVDPLTGYIDMSIISAGTSMQTKRKRQEIKDLFMEFVKESRKPSQFTYSTPKVLTEFREKYNISISRQLFHEALQELFDESKISLFTEKVVRLN